MNRSGVGFLEAGTGPALVFLHGVGSDKSAWAGQVARFSPRFHAIALDYPGYGDTPPDLSLTRDGLCAWLWRRLDDLGVRHAHLVGLSMGGTQALGMALQQPARVLSLTLADSFAHHPDGAAIAARAREQLQAHGMAQVAAARVPVLLAPGHAPALARSVEATMAAIPAATFAWATPIVWETDLRSRLDEVRAPTLVLVGAEDRVTPPALSEALHLGIAHSRLVVLPGAGHLSNLEDPGAFDAALDLFLAGLAGVT